MRTFHRYLKIFWIILQFLAVTLLLRPLSGCVVQEAGGDFIGKFRGERALAGEDTRGGLAYFQDQVAEHPENAQNHYYLGRILLRMGESTIALHHLEEAARLEPANPDYHFWLGVGYGEAQRVKQERASYQAALAIAADHEQALTALGHSYLRAKQYSRALDAYDQALAVWPENPAALYNRALALAGLKRNSEERMAWHRYLQVSPFSVMARYAVEHLNDDGDFSYRNYVLGQKMVSAPALRFVGGTAQLDPGSSQSLQRIGETMADLQSGVLQIVVYQKNDATLAKARAVAVRRHLETAYPGIGSERIGISWFGQARRDRKKKYLLEESVDFFVTNK